MTDAEGTSSWSLHITPSGDWFMYRMARVQVALHRVLKAQTDLALEMTKVGEVVPAVGYDFAFWLRLDSYVQKRRKANRDMVRSLLDSSDVAPAPKPAPREVEVGLGVREVVIPAADQVRLEARKAAAAAVAALRTRREEN